MRRPAEMQQKQAEAPRGRLFYGAKVVKTGLKTAKIIIKNRPVFMLFQRHNFCIISGLQPS